MMRPAGRCSSTIRLGYTVSSPSNPGARRFALSDGAATYCVRALREQKPRALEPETREPAHQQREALFSVSLSVAVALLVSGLARFGLEGARLLLA